MEIINKEWCEQHGMEKPYANVARDTSYCLVKDRYYIVIYTESTTGEKKLFVQNPAIKKSVEMIMPKYDFKLDKHNDFTTDDLQKLCNIVDLEYPFTLKNKIINKVKDMLNDPVTGCDLYKDEGCSHVDGLLCNYPDCEILKEHKTNCINKKDIRLNFIHHPNPRRIIEENYSEYFKYNEKESLYFNIVNFLEVVRVNNLWDSLEKIMK